MKTGIGAVLIVKNEEDVLPRCLESLKDLDEIIVLDTGSDDGTISAARKGGATVYSFMEEGPFHFAKARNEALAHLKSRWALSIDADEVLKDGAVWPMKAALVASRHTAYRLDFHDRAPGSDIAFTCRRVRVFRADRWMWRGRIHEELVGTSESSLRGVGDFGPEISMEHHPRPMREKRRLQNLELINLALVEEPGRKDLWKKMGGEMLLRGEFGESIRYFQEFIRVAEETALDMSETLIQLGQAYAGAGKLEDAIAAFKESSRIAPSRREPLWHAYLELMKKNRLLDALFYLEQVLRIPVESKPTFWLNLEPVWGNLPLEALDYCKGLVDKTLGPEKARDFWDSWEAQKNLPPVAG